MMDGTGKIIIITTACLFLLSCDLLVNSGSGETNHISYYSKEVELSTYVDPDGYFLEPVESRIYNEEGELSVIFRHYYSDMENTGYYANDRTEVFEIDDSGGEALVEYYLYEYVRDDYEYTDEEGATLSAFDYILSRGETYDSEDRLVLYYDVTYTAPSATGYEYYTAITDYQTGSPDKEIARQESTYISDGYGDLRYRTEKFYNLADSAAASVSLAKEFACWYDSAAPYDYLYELYHSVRSDDGSDEYYYLTRYARNESGDIYEQADWVYDSAGSSPVPKEGDGSFAVPFSYDVDFADIGEKATVLKSLCDSLGNYVLDERSLDGVLSEYTTYTYNSHSELTDKSRYTDGGTLLYDRLSIRYRDEYRDGVYYRIREESQFKYYDPYNSRSIVAQRIEYKKNSEYRKISNHHYR
ncbi:MAG: hypothetical protein JXR86_17545 [Spirochaetales bacterium]|nr:hypothetical protein [Spirochaetales bacterium]